MSEPNTPWELIHKPLPIIVYCLKVLRRLRGIQIPGPYWEALVYRTLNCPGVSSGNVVTMAVDNRNQPNYGLLQI
ncbi:unnamed protein product [Oppiella nova]|uniref:Uncharacterized protein n=1 Tax=Oppiella nova TaxID=334625 RepID=A0A7R9QWB4_9ACAR|nr:unnamed protein product [Oppiella nova]CAG2178007.1 unnamed protein product [Oppiella nova]